MVTHSTILFFTFCWESCKQLVSCWFVHMGPQEAKVNVSNTTYCPVHLIQGYGQSAKSYIATQAPMVNTVEDFWEMVWQEESAIIVMIVELKEMTEVRRSSGMDKNILALAACIRRNRN